MAYRLGELTIGSLLVLYWAQVLSMATRAHRRTGRAANLIPRRPLDRILRLIWAPVIIVWICSPIVAGAMPKAPWPVRPFWTSALAAWLGAAVVFTCWLLSQICWKTMGRNWRMGIDPSERTNLVLLGPFKYVRHPIYLLSQIMMLAVVVALPTMFMIVAAACHLILLQWEARREEQYLLQTHGQAYADYCLHVRRFIPIRRNRTVVRST